MFIPWVGEEKLFFSTLLGSVSGVLQIKLTKARVTGKRAYYVCILEGWAFIEKN